MSTADIEKSHVLRYFVANEVNDQLHSATSSSTVKGLNEGSGFKIASSNNRFLIEIGDYF